MTTRILSVDFEVFGKVQGVFFRKCTQQKAISLGLRGWCQNTNRGTVTGSMEGEDQKIEEMKKWLQYEGSPMSKIDKATFTNEKQIEHFTFTDFSVKH